MDKIGGNQFHGLSNSVKKKRSQTSRRPHPSTQAVAESSSQSSLSSNTNYLNKGSSDENAACDASSKRKEFNLNQFVSQASSVLMEGERSHMKIKRDGGYTTSHKSDSGWSGSHNNRCSEGVLAPANWKSSSKLKDGLKAESSVAVHGRGNVETLNFKQSGVLQHALGNVNGMKKLKLKVGGLACTVKVDSSSDGASKSNLPVKSSRYTDATRPHQNFLGYSDDSRSPSDKRNGLQGIPWKDFSKDGFTLANEYSLMGKLSGKNTSDKQGDNFEPTRKSRRVAKKRALEGQFSDGGDDDDEIRYMEKLKTSKVSTVYRNDEESSKKHRKLSNIDSGPSKLGNDAKKKSRSDRLYDDADYEEEEDFGSDGEREDKQQQEQKKESIDSLMDSKREMTLTARQRALQSSKDSSATNARLIEFPNGLPTTPAKKQKEKLSELEQQLKKSEAAQRRRMQVEKAARESEAEAIRKILGQDSSRKKREEKIKKRQEALAQERAANTMMLAPNSIRLIMRPAGTVVIFSEDIGLPSIFDSKPCSYPCPRENCAGPSCTNPYKYRDSRSRLPLCSLQCYKAIQEKIVAEATC